MNERPRTMTAEERGLIGSGKPVYEHYCELWRVYKHPLPQWDGLSWEARDVWNQIAERAAHDLSEQTIWELQNEIKLMIPLHEAVAEKDKAVQRERELSDSLAEALEQLRPYVFGANDIVKAALAQHAAMRKL